MAAYRFKKRQNDQTLSIISPNGGSTTIPPTNTMSKSASTSQLQATISPGQLTTGSTSSFSVQPSMATPPAGSVSHIGSLTSGAKAGIAIGVILGAISLYLVAILCFKREIRKEAAAALIERHKLALILSEKIVNENTHSDLNLPARMAELEAREIRNPDLHPHQHPA